MDVIPVSFNAKDWFSWTVGKKLQKGLKVISLPNNKKMFSSTNMNW